MINDSWSDLRLAADQARIDLEKAPQASLGWTTGDIVRLMLRHEAWQNVIQGAQKGKHPLLAHLVLSYARIIAAQAMHKRGRKGTFRFRVYDNLITDEGERRWKALVYETHEDLDHAMKVRVPMRDGHNREIRLRKRLMDRLASMPAGTMAGTVLDAVIEEMQREEGA